MKRMMKSLLILAVSLFCVSIFGFFQDQAVMGEMEISASLIVVTLCGSIAAMAGYIVFLFKNRVDVDRIHAERIERITAQHAIKIEEILASTVKRTEELTVETHQVMSKFNNTLESIKLVISNLNERNK